jgi:hypothetical protein
MEKNLWLVYVILAGLAWGTYVPVIFYGGGELGGKFQSRMLAILCVGGAYFVIGVLLPLYFLFTGSEGDKPTYSANGLIFSSLAGIAGAVGALCVVFASGEAMKVGVAMNKLDPTFDKATYRMFIAPLIFGLAPVINVLVSSIWHPAKGGPADFHLELPGWKLWLGIVFVGVGAALVLFSKEEAESHKVKPGPAVIQSATPPTGGVS